jgi:hypothetical protein
MITTTKILETFGTDPDPGISTTDLRIRIRILLFSSVADKMQAKNKFLFKVFFTGKFTPVFKDKKTKKMHWYSIALSKI